MDQFQDLCVFFFIRMAPIVTNDSGTYGYVLSSNEKTWLTYRRRKIETKHSSISESTIFVFFSSGFFHFQIQTEIAGKIFSLNKVTSNELYELFAYFCRLTLLILFVFFFFHCNCAATADTTEQCTTNKMVHPITVAVGLGLGLGAIIFTLIYGNRFPHPENPQPNRQPSNARRPRQPNLYEPSSE